MTYDKALLNQPMLGYSHMVNIVVAATNATISVSTGDHWHGTLVQVAATEVCHKLLML